MVKLSEKKTRCVWRATELLVINFTFLLLFLSLFSYLILSSSFLSLLPPPFSHSSLLSLSSSPFTTPSLLIPFQANHVPDIFSSGTHARTSCCAPRSQGDEYKYAMQLYKLVYWNMRASLLEYASQFTSQFTGVCKPVYWSIQASLLEYASQFTGVCKPMATNFGILAHSSIYLFRVESTMLKFTCLKEPSWKVTGVFILSLSAWEHSIG